MKPFVLPLWSLAVCLGCMAVQTPAVAEDKTLVDRPLQQALGNEPYKTTWARVTADVDPKIAWVKTPAASGASQRVAVGAKHYLVAFGEQPGKKSVGVTILFGDDGKTAVALISNGKGLEKFVGAPTREERAFLIESSGPD